jgi:hypothetical protein
MMALLQMVFQMVVILDFGTAAPTVTCPADVGATYDFVTGTATASVTYNVSPSH